jgi:hypothetical protein
VPGSSIAVVSEICAVLLSDSLPMTLSSEVPLVPIMMNLQVLGETG